MIRIWNASSLRSQNNFPRREWHVAECRGEARQSHFAWQTWWQINRDSRYLTFPMPFLILWVCMGYATLHGVQDYGLLYTLRRQFWDNCTCLFRRQFVYMLPIWPNFNVKSKDRKCPPKVISKLVTHKIIWHYHHRY